MCLYVETRTLTAFQPLSTVISKAIVAVVVSAMLSLLAFAFIILRIIRDAMVNRTYRRPKILFFRTQLGHYACCLILSNMFISAAGLIDIRWLTRSGLTSGLICSVQAVLIQIGVWGTCWFTVAYGVHALSSLAFCARQVYWHSAVIIIIGWAIALVAALIPMTKGNIYGPAGISCSITHSHLNEIIFLGALPIVITIFLSATVYSLTFIAWYRKHGRNYKRKTVALGSTYRRGEDKPVEYHKFINMVIWTTFLFPLAFVFLMLPLCIIRILVHSGQQVPPALNIFADACASILGFVNICLLLNTLRVISRVSHAARIARETMTFGHDASKESPTAPHFHSHSEISSFESGCRTYSSSQPSHSHSSSCSSVDSNTGLIHAEKTSYASTQTRTAPLSMHIIPPAELGRQLDEPNITSPNTKSKRNGLHAEIITSPSHMVNISLSPPPIGGERVVKAWMQDKKHLFESMADTEPLGKGVKERGLRPEVPLKADLSGLPIRPPPLSYPVTDKLAAPATRFGVSAPLSNIASQVPAIYLGPDNKAHSIHRVSAAPSYTSTGTFSSDTDSDCSGELMHAYKVRLSSQAPQPGDDEEVFRGSMLPQAHRRSAWTRRITMDTIWSQGSESMPMEEEVQEGYWQVIAELLGGPAGEQADAPAKVVRRQSTFGPRDVRPVTLRVQPRTRALSKCSVHFDDTLDKPSTTKGVSNKSVV